MITATVTTTAIPTLITVMIIESVMAMAICTV